MSTPDLPTPDDTLVVEQPAGYDQIPTAVWMHRGVSAGAAVAYMAIRRYGLMHKGRAMPRREVIADDLGVSVGTLDLYVNELVEAGWLLVEPRFRPEGRGQTTNQYLLLWTPIESATDERLVRHLKAMTDFNAAMDAYVAQRARAAGKAPKARSARTSMWKAEAVARRHEEAERIAAKRARAASTDTPAQNLEPPLTPLKILSGGGSESWAGGAQDFEPQEPHCLEPHFSADAESATAPAVASQAALIDIGPATPATPKKARAPRSSKAKSRTTPERSPRHQAALVEAQRLVEWHINALRKARNVAKLPEESQAYNALVGAGRTEGSAQYVTAALLAGVPSDVVTAVLARAGRECRGNIPAKDWWISAITAEHGGRPPVADRQWSQQRTGTDDRVVGWFNIGKDQAPAEPATLAIGGAQ